MLLANEATYRKLSTFQSVEELNEAMKVHKSNHKLSDTEREVLDLISRYSCRYPGVCYLSKNKIGEAVGRVRRTIIRVCNRLEELGIIKQYETKRDGGDRRQSTNVIVILAAEMPDLANREGSPNLETSSDEQAKAKTVSYSKRGTCQHIGNSGVPSSKRSPVNGNNPVIRNSDEQTFSPIGEEVTPEMSRHKAPSNKLNNIIYNNTYASTSFYGRFKAFIQSTIGKDSQALISRLYGVYKGHSTPLLRLNAFDKEDVEQVGWQALHAAIMATKRKNIRNIAGYYSGVLDRMLDRLYFESMSELYG